jgi:quercetin dioxygenase-like cupin family protein
VSGDRKKGPFVFFMRMAADSESPWHSHDSDLWGVIVTGTLEHPEQGAEDQARPLPPGSYLLQAAKKVHKAKCVAGADCLMFLTAKGGYNTKPAPTPAPAR